MGTRHAAGARSPRTHDLDRPGGVHSRAIQPYRCETPLTPGTHPSADDRPTSKDEIEEVADRPYREVLGALTWLALGTRPDIAFTTSSFARFRHNPGRVH